MYLLYIVAKAGSHTATAMVASHHRPQNIIELNVLLISFSFLFFLVILFLPAASHEN